MYKNPCCSEPKYAKKQLIPLLEIMKPDIHLYQKATSYKPKNIITNIEKVEKSDGFATVTGDSKKETQI